jgi:type IV secretory pathway VirB2 component (pilin)
MARSLITLIAALCSAATFAQPSQQGDWLVETMYRSGKINTVVAVVAVVLAGLATWMFLMDQRLRRLEREQKLK